LYNIGFKHLLQCGKAVPVIIPPETIPVLDYLSDVMVRKEAGINSCNPYLFANTSKISYLFFKN
jgi:hypothetical protein